MAVKILSVDDERDLGVLLTQYFRRQIWKGEYKFAFAHNGLETLQKLLETLDFDIILSDINMPEMDGLTLLAKINELKNLAMKSIMVSAYGDMDNINRPDCLPKRYGQRKTTVYSGLNMTIARDCGTNIIRMLLSCDYWQIIGTFWKANHRNNWSPFFKSKYLCRETISLWVRKTFLFCLADFCTSSSGQLGIDQTESVDPDAGCGWCVYLDWFRR